MDKEIEEPTMAQIQEAIKRQDEFAAKVKKIQDKCYEVHAKWVLSLKELTPIMTEIDGGKEPDPNMTKEQAWAEMIKKYTNPEYKKKLDEKLFSDQRYKESKKHRNEWEKLLLEYNEGFAQFIDMLNKDRDILFTPRYKKRMEELADEGWFLYFLQTPDVPIELLESPEFSDCVTFTADESLLLLYSDILKESPSDNEPTIAVRNDIKESLICFRIGAYRACARTLCALLEHEHKMFSDVKERSTGKIRADKITENVQITNITYYKNCWKKIDTYYKKINMPTDKRDKNVVNRNELAHGEYDVIVTPTECLKLFFMYNSMKEMSHYLQGIYEVTELAGDYIRAIKSGVCSDKNIKTDTMACKSKPSSN